MISVHLTDALRGTLSECPFPVHGSNITEILAAYGEEAENGD